KGPWMLTLERRLRSPMWLALAGVAIALGVAAVPLADADGRVDPAGVPQVRLPLAAAEGEPAASLPQAGAPAPASATLLEAGAFGPVPRVAADGRRPFLAYARPFDLDGQRPKVALLVTGLGLQADPTEAALRLPGAISLHFSAYASDLPSMLERARSAGHEVLLDLPMEPPDYPASDPGPHALLAGAATGQNLQRLDWLLARATGYVGLAGGGSRFATSPQAPPVLDVLTRRGLAMVELGGDDLAAAATAVGLPYASARAAIDADPSVQAIDYALAGLEADALRTGTALGVAQGYPVSLERLRLWAATLEEKGLALAPVSAVMILRSGPAAGRERNGETPGRSQG
ncbi:MAG TPA: divergent polysaccharide deacetylase family protein, partial [Geminicoccaceae bacterium]|nr:divergent polysaccharide deacetylase family protein [Geminicoccaceae bacterium]